MTATLCWQPWLLTPVAVGVLIVAQVRPLPSVTVPPRVPASQVEPWMADCLPGVGIKSRDHVAAQIRAGQWDDLSAKVRQDARLMFSDGRSSPR